MTTCCQLIEIREGERTSFLHIEALICYVNYGADIKRKQLISLIVHCKILFRVFSCSTAPCKDADPSSVEKSIDEIQEIGKLKVITSRIVLNGF